MAVYYIFLAQPMLNKITDYTKEEERIGTQLKNAEKFFRDKEELTNEIKDIEEKIKFFENRLPKKNDISQVLDDLIRIGKKTDITFISIEPKAVESLQIQQSSKIYLQIPIELKLMARYHDFALFVNNVENFYQFMRVDNIQIKTADKDDLKHDITLTVSAFALKGASDDVQAN